MPLYQITPRELVRLDETSFAEAGYRERTDIQRLLKEQIEVISPDTLVIAEEFGDWEDSRRRIDLLGLDNEANLVVIELKRTEDGGHMELQALRYAAMVSTMTFEQVVGVFAAHLLRNGSTKDARTEILAFLGWDEPDEERFAKDVRIVLASADFSREITSAVLWLNERSLDIRCVRLHPYVHEGHVFLDVQQVIPLPEAADYQVRHRQKAQREQVARQSAYRDLTKFTVVSSSRGERSHLPKRRAVYEVIRSLVEAGVSISGIESYLRHRLSSPLRSADGLLEADAFVEAVTNASRASGQTFHPDKYFCSNEELIRADGRTYALSNQWGIDSMQAVWDLLRAFPDRGVTCTAESVSINAQE